MVNILLLWHCERKAVWVVVWVCVYLVHYRFVSIHQDIQLVWRFGVVGWLIYWVMAL